MASYKGHAYCRIEFINLLRKLSKPDNVDVLIVWNGDQLMDYQKEFKVIEFNDKGLTAAELLAAKQNVIRDYVLENDYSHLLMLESDTFCPDDSLEQLLSHNLDYVAGVYLTRSVRKHNTEIPEEQKKILLEKTGKSIDYVMALEEKLETTAWVIHRDDFGDSSSVRKWEVNDYISHLLSKDRHPVVPVLASALGCVLMTKKCLELVKFENKNDTIGDFNFGRDLYMSGIQPYVDMNVYAEHRHIQGNSRVIKHKFFDSVKLTKSYDKKPPEAIVNVK